MPLIPGARLGKYEILGPLGSGGMGEVYRAHDTRLGRDVAIKILKDRHAQDPDWLGRFEREARLLASLNHGNIATVYGLDEAEGVRYLVMELVAGRTLAQRLAAGPLPLDEALDICRQIAEALEAAHERGIIHRDLKPANVMITPEGKGKVLDFGLARSFGPQPDPACPTGPFEVFTQEGVIVGTPAYMAPEQARGKPLDKRCDLWALGCVLYEVIAGRSPFGGETYSDMLAAVLRQAPDWDALPAGVPPRVADLVRRCLQKDPKQRLRDAGDARLEIEQALADLAQAPPLSAPTPKPPRWPMVAGAGVGLVVFVLGMVAQHLRQESSRVSPDILQPNPQSAWSGKFLSGETTPAFGPRVSPDGRWVAFLVLQAGQTQVAVMDLRSGVINMLTQKSNEGSPHSLCWSPDSGSLYFDRIVDKPAGVFSISPLKVGDHPRVVLEEAGCPQSLMDGSLIVNRYVSGNEDGNLSRLVRHWPGAAGPDQEIGPPIRFSLGWPTPVRALHKSNRVVFCGQLPGTEKEAAATRHFYLLDLDANTQEGRSPQKLSDENIPIDLVPLAVSPDDRYLYTVLPVDDLFQLVRIPLDKSGPIQRLMMLTTRAYGLDMDDKGSLYIDQFRRPMEVLRFDTTVAGMPVRIASTSQEWETDHLGAVDLPGGRALMPGKSLGRSRLLVAGVTDPEPLLPHDPEESSQPATRVGPNGLAFLAGPRGERRVKIVELAPRVRPIRTLKDVPGDGLDALAASPTGEKLYFIRKGQVYQVEIPANPAKENAPPQFVTKGNGVAVYPDTGELLIQRYNKEGVRLYRMKDPESKLVPVPVKEGAENKVALRLAPYPLGARAINKDGRILVGVTSPDSWLWRVALLDKDGTLKAIPVTYDGEIFSAIWDEGGKVLGIGFPVRSELWRLTPPK